MLYGYTTSLYIIIITATVVVMIVFFITIIFQEIPSHPLNEKTLQNCLKNRDILEEEFRVRLLIALIVLSLCQKYFHFLYDNKLNMFYLFIYFTENSNEYA